MTGALDTEMRALAVELTDELGKAVTLIREETAYDPSSGETTTMTSTASANATPPADFTLSRIDGTLIQQGDTVIDVPAQGLDMGTPDAPQQTDKVRIDGTKWGIVQVGKVYSGEQIALYRLHLRR